MHLIDDFFRNIIPARLDEPTHASIEFENGSRPLTAIVVPTIDSDGGLAFDFFDTIANLGSDISSAFDVASSVTIQFENTQTMTAVTTRLRRQILTAVGQMRLQGRLMAVQREVHVTDGLIASAEFCVEDFPLFWGTMAFERTELSDSESTYYESSRILGRTKLEADGWGFTMSECPDKSELNITHSGSVYRTDGQPFSTDNLRHVIDGLTYFFTFVTGVYRTPTIVIAYGSERQAVWGRFARFKQSRFHGDNWFNPQGRETLARLFPGFWNCFENHPQELCSVVGNYAESSMIAHAGLPKNALSDSQTALEGVSRWMLGREKPSKESAKDFIREALDKTGIVHDLYELPNILKVWQDRYKESQDDDDGPTFITRLRNRSTHAEFTQMNSSDYLHAWNLSQQYVELILLRLFGYDQEYYDRTRKGLLIVPYHAEGPLSPNPPKG